MGEISYSVNFFQLRPTNPTHGSSKSHQNKCPSRNLCPSSTGPTTKVSESWWSMIRCSTSPEHLLRWFNSWPWNPQLFGGHVLGPSQKGHPKLLGRPTWTSDLQRLIQNIFRALALCMIQQGVERRNKGLRFFCGKTPVVEFDRRWKGALKITISTWTCS